MNEMLKTLNTLCGFRSVTQRTDDPAYPYGEETNKALKFMLETCEGFGFRTVNLDNQLGYAEIGEGEELFGILAHLDVVPVGSGWDHEPFAATVSDDGYIFMKTDNQKLFDYSLCNPFGSTVFRCNSLYGAVLIIAYIVKRGNINALNFCGINKEFFL